MDDTMVVTGSLRLTGSLVTTGSAIFRVNTDRNLATRFDTNILLSAQSDSGAPESLRVYADTFRLFTATTAVGLTERLTISNTGAATFSSSVTAISSMFVQAINNSDLPFINFSNNGRSFDWGRVGGLLQGDGDGALYFQTKLGVGLTEKMRITSAGNVGIGITNPSYILHIPQNNNLFLGNLYITGTANNPILSSGATGGSIELDGGGAGTGRIFLQGAAGGGNGYIEFRAGGSLRMTIASNGNIGAPSGTNIYNASDARLKQNIETIVNGLDKIVALNPVKFNWIDGFEPNEDGKDMLGFIAQEVQEVVPEAVENFNNNAITVGDTVIENSLRVNEKFIIPVLVKAIQELKAEIDKLKNK
jgi:hypothetical protein